MTSRGILVGIVVAMAAGSGVAIWIADRPSQLETPSAQAEKGSLNRKALLAGVVFPKRRENVLPRMPGRVEAVKVTRGEHVRSGQTMLVMDQDGAQTEVERKVLALKRVQALQTDGPSQTSEIEVRQAELDLRTARHALANTILTAPFDGVVVFVGVRPGDTLTPNSAASIVVADTSTYTVEVEGDEYDCGRVKIGAFASIRIASSAAELTTGRVIEPPVLKRLGTASTSSTFGFVVQFDSVPTEPLFGISAQVEVELSRVTNAILVPVTSIHERDGISYVNVVSARGVEEHRVVVLLFDEHVAAVDGIPEGTRVALDSAGSANAK